MQATALALVLLSLGISTIALVDPARLVVRRGQVTVVKFLLRWGPRGCFLGQVSGQAEMRQNTTHHGRIVNAGDEAHLAPAFLARS